MSLSMALGVDSYDIYLDDVETDVEKDVETEVRTLSPSLDKFEQFSRS